MAPSVTNVWPRYDYYHFLEAMIIMWAFGTDLHNEALATEMGREVNARRIDTGDAFGAKTLF